MPRAAYNDQLGCVTSMHYDTVGEAIATAKRWTHQGYPAWVRDENDIVVWDSALEQDDFYVETKRGPEGGLMQVHTISDEALEAADKLTNALLELAEAIHTLSRKGQR